MIVIQDVVYLVPFNPKDVPIVTLSFLVTFLAEGVKYAVPERSLKLDVRWMRGVVLFLDVLAEVLRHFIFKFNLKCLLTIYAYKHSYMRLNNMILTATNSY